MSNKIQFKRGLKQNLPSSADVGMPLWCTDTQELYIGTGNSVSKVGGVENQEEQPQLHLIFLIFQLQMNFIKY